MTARRWDPEICATRPTAPEPWDVEEMRERAGRVHYLKLVSVRPTLRQRVAAWVRARLFGGRR